MKNIALVPLLGLALTALAASAHADTITTGTADLTTLGNWQGTYGTLGYSFFEAGVNPSSYNNGTYQFDFNPGANNVVSLPSWLSQNSSAGYGVTAGDFATINNPSGGNFISGVLGTSTGGVAGSYDLYDLTVLSGAPSSFRLTLLVDNNDNSGRVPTGLTLSSDNGGSATFSNVVNNINKPEWYTFNISGVTAGDVLHISGIGSSSNTDVTLGGATFQAAASAVPEPSTYASLVIGVLALIGIQRFRSLRV